jgi:hypothetical protein
VDRFDRPGLRFRQGVPRRCAPGYSQLQRLIDPSAAGQVLLKYRWPAVGNHTVKIVNLATSGHRKIDVDGFVSFS